MITKQGNLRRWVGRFKLDIVNRILLLYIWLRKYPHLDTLSLMFDVSTQTVSALIYQGIIVLWRYFRSNVTWPTNREWNEKRNKLQQFPITRPSVVLMLRHVKLLFPPLNPETLLQRSQAFSPFIYSNDL